MNGYVQLFKGKDNIKQINNNKTKEDQESQLLQQICEQNKIYCNDSKIYRNENINFNFNDLEKWPKRSPYEFTNKNILIPEDYKIPSNNVKDLKKQKLKKIDDEYYFEDISQSPLENRQIDQNNMPKVRVVFPEIQNNNKIINIDKNIRKNDINNSNNNEIIYNFGYKKEDRLIPLKLDLIKDTIDEQEIEYQNYKKENSLRKDTNQLNRNIKIREKTKRYYINNINNYSKDNTENNSDKIKSLNQEVDQEFNLTLKQMNIMGEEVNKIYNDYKKMTKEKEFYFNHPYIKYKDNPEQNRIIYKNKYTPPFYVRNKNKNKILNKKNNGVKIPIPLIKSSLINKSNNFLKNIYYSGSGNKNSCEKVMRRNFSQVINDNGNKMLKQEFNFPVINDNYGSKKAIIKNNFEFHMKYN